MSDHGLCSLFDCASTLLTLSQIMKVKVQLFDAEKARATINKGRRANWWSRAGGTSRGFRYVDKNGKIVTDAAAIERIKSLAIPPAWKYVKINPSATGKIQAVGMDTTGRVQYLYHPTFAARQKRLKFSKLERFGALLPKLRETTNRDISVDGLPREKVLAVVMRLINSLYFRVGTDHSAKHYETYGITTFQKRHLTIGKKGRLCNTLDSLLSYYELHGRPWERQALLKARPVAGDLEFGQRILQRLVELAVGGRACRARLAPLVLPASSSCLDTFPAAISIHGGRVVVSVALIERRRSEGNTAAEIPELRGQCLQGSILGLRTRVWRPEQFDRATGTCISGPTTRGPHARLDRLELGPSAVQALLGAD